MSLEPQDLPESDKQDTGVGASFFTIEAGFTIMSKIRLADLLKLFKRKNKFRVTEQLAEKARIEKSAFCPCRSANGFTYHVCGVTEQEGDKIDLLSQVHRNSNPLKNARQQAVKGNQYWHKGKYVQMYRPAQSSGAPQTEVYYDQLGLGMNEPNTIIGTKRD